MRKLRLWIIIPLTLAAILVLAVAALAQTGDEYDLAWSTIDGGGGISEGGVYSLSGTIGQPDAGSAFGGTYTLDSGFWVRGIQAVLDFITRLPVVFR